MQERKKGFTYTVGKEQIEDYRKWPLKRRLQWLLISNQMRKSLPPQTIEVQEAFRQDKI